MSDKEEVKMIALDDIFSDTDLAAAERMFNEHQSKPFKGGLAKALALEVIEPSIQLINYRAGQENDPMYLGYALEHVLTQMNQPPKKIA